MRRAGALAAIAVSVALAGDAAANGNAVQRETVGRVVSFDARHGTLVVERELRGQTYRLTLRTKPETPAFRCAADRASLDGVKRGDPVSVYYEPMGRGALANLVIVEPR
ncbi:MAG: hypothetical protein HYR51_03415 [Candidatus Rokubacteria bacterium]|nr:hypothetical protein [Candidatus Rokubacteria bacterium]